MPPPPEAAGRWRALTLLVIASWLGLGTWFSAGAVLPQLIAKYGVDPETASLLSVFVNAGFLCGALAGRQRWAHDDLPGLLHCLGSDFDVPWRYGGEHSRRSRSRFGLGAVHHR